MGTINPPSTAMTIVCRIGSRFVALPMQTVVHTARFAELTPASDVSAIVCGVVSVHGATVPVIDGRSLLGEPLATISVAIFCWLLQILISRQKSVYWLTK